MPHRVVLHVHCVDTLSWALRQDAAERLAERLPDLSWGFVPYVQPGVRLRDAVRALLERGPVDVVVLGNHGLVVGAATCADAVALLERVRARVRVPVGAGPTPDLRALQARARLHDLRLPRHGETHRIALEPAALRLARGGSLYPDHVVFLGPGVSCAGEDAGARSGAPKLVVFPRLGVLLAPDLDTAADEMARALIHVVSRVAVEAPVRYLTDEEEAQLLSWNAERYRQSLVR